MKIWRLVAAIALLSLPVACGPKEEEIACCAIVPKAKCDAALHALKVTREESDAMFGPGDRCPSTAMSMERIRELDSEWPQACREAGMFSPLLQLGTHACPDTSAMSPPTGIDPIKWAACGTGLKRRGLKENELWVMQHSDEICPNAGVTEARIREILDKDWDAAGCTYATKDQALTALTSGACGGNAG